MPTCQGRQVLLSNNPKLVVNGVLSWSKMLPLFAELGFDPNHPYDTEICKTFEEYMCVSTLRVSTERHSFFAHALIDPAFILHWHKRSFVWFNWHSVGSIGQDATLWRSHLPSHWVRCAAISLFADSFSLYTPPYSSVIYALCAATRQTWTYLLKICLKGKNSNSPNMRIAFVWFSQCYRHP